MKHISKYASFALIASFFVGTTLPVKAGNPDRAGSAGGQQLLINPWVRSNALSGSNMASASPLESMFLNVAGMAMVKQTEIGFTHINYLSGADVGINSLGLVQRVGETGALGLSVSSYNFGDIRRTTTETPDGDGTFFNVNMLNIGLSYAKAFSNSIYGGLTVKLVSEGVADLRASGVAFDAGIKYVTGERDQVQFGISLRNIGPPLSFSGDGLSFETQAPAGDHSLTAEWRSQNYELPSLVNIGISYDFLFTEDHGLTASGAFVANSFTQDNFLVGAEYNFKQMLYLRAGYHYEPNITDKELRRIAYTGFSAGAGLQFEFGEKKTRMSVDYAYRASDPFNGTHGIGARIHIGRTE